MEKKQTYMVIAVVLAIIIAAIGAALVFNNGNSDNNQPSVDIVSLKKTASSPAYSPLDEAAVYNNSYAMSRYLYLYTNGVPESGTPLYKWLSFALNATDGQVLVGDSGFYPLQTSDLNAMHAQLANGNVTGPSGNFKEGGSTTLADLSNLWAATFLNETGIHVTISLGGSGTGIANFINGVIDVAQASRAMTASEHSQAAAKGIDVVEWKVAVDGITIIVNPANPVKALTMSQLEGIFNGTITNWNQIGGNNQAISLFGRDSASGTFATFQGMVLVHGENYSASMQQFTSNALIVPEVENSVGGIGYVGIGYAKAAA